MANKALNVSKVTKNNEFYTQYKDVEKEIENYIECDHEVFKDKTILLPCDDYDWSNFTKYFVDNFERFGLKKLISTSYAKSVGSHDTRGKLFMLTRSKDGSGRGDKFSGYLEGDGDFRSEEVTALRDEADIIVTNPPFSLFREFLAWIVEADKKFIIIGNKNAITYKEVFPLIKDNKMWLGFSQPKEFGTPNGMTNKVNGLTRWFTNVDTKKRHHKLETVYRWRKRKEKYPDLYPKYDNYDAIEVSKVLQIPLDYDGIMGVPITFLDKYNPDQFEVLGLTTGRKEFSKESWPTKRYINALQHKSTGQIVNGSKANTRATIAVNNPKGTYYTADNSNKKLEIKYARILIKNKHPEDYQNDL